MMFLLEWILKPIEFVISAIGIVIVIWGVIQSLQAFTPFFYADVEKHAIEYKKIRIMLAQYILLGLEFLVASDVIYTVRAHDYQSLIVLVCLVVLRVLLSYSLDREIKNFK